MMAYIIERFGDTYATAEVLPTAGGDQPQGGVGARSGLVALPGGGSFDAWGSERARLRPQEITVEGYWSAASVAAMEAKLAKLKALAGVRSKLWRSNGVSQQWRYARLMQVDSPAREGTPTIDEVSLVFEALPGPWYGTAHDDTTTLDTSPKAITVTNGGNMWVTNAILTLTAGSAKITEVVISMTGVSEIQWTGSLAAGQSLAIDCGARSVKKAGADAYAGFALGAGHAVEDWLRLEPGNNSIVVSLMGGSTDSTLRVQYADGWA
jgi:hypothetical protein